MLNNSTAMVGAQGGYGVVGQAQVPKPIGLMQRVDGVRTGLAELQERLEALASRLTGAEADPKEASPNMPASIGCLPSILNSSEAHLRNCLRLAGNFNDTF